MENLILLQVVNIILVAPTFEICPDDFSNGDLMITTDTMEDLGWDNGMGCVYDEDNWTVGNTVVKHHKFLVKYLTFLNKW